MVEEKETSILMMNDIKITTSKVVSGSDIYKISSIKSVSHEQKNIPPVVGKAVVIVSFVSLILGILFCLATFAIHFIQVPGFFSDWPRINVHFLFAGIGLLLMTLWSMGFEANQSTTHMVQIETESGKTTILESKDKDFIQRIINAINNAIVHRV